MDQDLSIDVHFFSCLFFINTYINSYPLGFGFCVGLKKKKTKKNDSDTWACISKSSRKHPNRTDQTCYISEVQWLACSIPKTDRFSSLSTNWTKPKQLHL